MSDLLTFLAVAAVLSLFSAIATVKVLQLVGLVGTNPFYLARLHVRPELTQVPHTIFAEGVITSTLTRRRFHIVQHAAQGKNCVVYLDSVVDAVKSPASSIVYVAGTNKVLAVREQIENTVEEGDELTAPISGTFGTSAIGAPFVFQ
jgi:hypothetical protein